MKGKNRTAEEKMEIVLEGLKEKKPIAQLCREHQISQALYYRWKERFLDSGLRGFQNGADQNVATYEAQIEKLEQLIGKQAIVIETLKKTAFSRTR